MFRHAAFIAILACGVLLAAARVTEPLDLELLDAQFRWLRASHPQPVARDVAVVGIDEDTAKRFPEPITLWHAHLGRFFTAQTLAKPAALGVDIVLPDRSYESVLPGSDKRLLKGLLDARLSFPVVLGQTVEPSGKTRNIHPLFLKIAGNAGYALFPVDGDGVVRRFDERLAEGGQTVPTLAGQLARSLKVEPVPGYIDYWRGAPFNYVPLQQVLEWAEKGDEAALARAFRDKAVLIGMVFPFEDRLRAPLQLAAWEPDAPNTPGVLLHAQVLRNLLNGGFVQPAHSVAIAAICAVLAALWFVSGTTGLIALLLAAVVAVLGGASTWLLAEGWYFPAVAPALTAALALGGRNGYDTLLKLRARRRLRASFGGYVSPPVMEEILAGRINPELGGAQKFVCVMFSDIRGYTTRSERMTPEQVIRFLNRYFERTVALIHERGGAVVSFMGDGIMAVFGAPKPLDNPCREAFESARAMLKYVGELNGQFRAEGEAPLDIGIGLHAGAAVVGHVGSSTRHDYTAIGDVTNVASRLEGLTKEAGYRVVLSSKVAEMLGGAETLTALGPMAIKGHTPVEVHGYDKVG
ncbi:MAG: adenylate/guanylate cyclase domain-containing protein [Betaproteobacteria bacterium]|nr:adenylate/guanylate cyclase domain-containing protein [Betaproteobacteria bacterium]